MRVNRSILKKHSDQRRSQTMSKNVMCTYTYTSMIEKDPPRSTPIPYTLDQWLTTESLQKSGGKNRSKIALLSFYVIKRPCDFQDEQFYDEAGK